MVDLVRCAFSLLVGIAFDEMDRLYSLLFMVGLTLVMMGTAFAYLRAARAWQRAVVLLAGVLAVVTVVAWAAIAYWLPQGGVHVGATIGYAIAIVGVMFLPALLGLAHRSIHSARIA